MPSIPLLQGAPDLASLPATLAMAPKAANEVDVTGIGTPLCKTASLEASMAFDPGADMITVVGGVALVAGSALHVAATLNHVGLPLCRPYSRTLEASLPQAEDIVFAVRTGAGG